MCSLFKMYQSYTIGGQPQTVIYPASLRPAKSCYVINYYVIIIYFDLKAQSKEINQKLNV